MRSTDEQTSQQQQLLVDEKSNLLLYNVSSSANHGSDRREDITSTLPTPPHSSATADSGASGTSTTSTAVNTTGPGIGGASAASNATTTTSSNNSSFAHNSDGTPRAASSGSPLTTTTRPVPNALERLASFEVCGPACQARRAMESLNNSFFSGSSAMKALQQCVSSTPKPPPHNHIQTLVDVSRRQHEQTTVADSVKGQNTWLVAQLQKRLQTAPEEHVIAKVMMVTHDLLAFGAPEFAHALAPVAESYFDPDSLIAHVPHHAEDGHNPLAETIDIYEHTTRFFISFVHTVLQFQLRHRSELNLLDPDATERFLQERNDGLQFWTPHMRDTVTSCMTLTKFVMAANTSVIMPRYNFVFSEIIRRYLLDSKQLYRIAMGSIQCMFHTTTEASKTPVAEIRRNMQGMSQFVILTEKLNDFYDAVRALPADVVNSPLQQQQQQQQQGTSSSTTSAASFQTGSGSDSLTDEEERRRQRRWEDATTSILTLVPPRLTTFSPEIHAMMRARLQSYEELENMNIDTLEFVLTSSSSSAVLAASSSSPSPPPPPAARAANTEPSSATLPSTPVVVPDGNPSVALMRASAVLETSVTFQQENSQRHTSHSTGNGDRSHHHSSVPESKHANVERSNRFQVLSEVLGRGGFGVVYKAWDEEEGKHVACKEVKLAEQNRTGVHELLKEYRVLTTLEHPNIVKVLDFMVHHGHGRIFMEWVPSGSVQSVLQETKRGLRETIVRRYVREALEGLAYLHSRGIVHRDVKPGNMLLASDGSVKLTDFGTSRSAEAAGETVQTGTVVGTVPYLAPECVRGTYSAASDVWAIGCTALHMITGRAPWVDEVRDNIGLIFKLGSLSSLPKGVSERDMSDDLRGFITAALTIDRYQRPSVAELLRHPFFKSGA